MRKPMTRIFALSTLVTAMSLMIFSCTRFAVTVVQLSDNVPPTAGDSGKLELIASDTSVEVRFSPGSDNHTKPKRLKYQVYYSKLDNLQTLSEALANGTPFGQPSTQVTSITVTGLSPSEAYYFNLILTDEADRKAAYQSASITTANIKNTVVIGQEFSDRVKQLEMLGINYSFWTDGTRMAIADTSRNRVLLFDSIPLSPNAVPDRVIGQPTLYEIAANNGGRSSRSLSSPTGLHYDGQKLYVADRGNFRILIWNEWPKSNHQAANTVIGATTFTEINTAVVDGSVMEPNNIHVHLGSLWVCDVKHHRVLKWNSIPTTNGTHADLVLGQPSFQSVGSNTGGISASSMSVPNSLEIVDNKLVLSDQGNFRVLIWNSLPTVNSTPADVVLGQPNMNTATRLNGGKSARSMSDPSGLSTDGTKLFLATFDHRILVWNSVPTTSFAPADIVLGYPDFNSSGENFGGLSMRSLYRPAVEAYAAGKVWVADRGNGRILSYDAASLSTHMEASLVWGRTLSQGPLQQPLGLSSFKGPTGVFLHGTKTFVADTLNNRVLIFNNLSGDPNQTPDVVLGQPDVFVTSANNMYDSASPSALVNAAPTARNMNGPTAVMTDGVRLYVADTGNNRVMVWNSIPTENYTAANLFLGQPDSVSNTAANPAVADGAKLNQPRGLFAVTSDGSNGNTRLLVADTGQNRVLMWSTLPTTDGTAANFAIGQASLSGFSGSITGANRMNAPEDVWTDGTKVAVADRGNNRVLLFDSYPTGNDATATTVIGQPAANVGTANNGGLSDRVLNRPTGVTFDGARLFIVDQSNNRVLMYNSWPSGVQPLASRVIGQVAFSIAAATGTLLNGPTKISVLAGKIAIANSAGTANNVKFLHSIPTINGAAFDFVMTGAGTSLERALNVDANTSPFLGVARPSASIRAGGRIYVADGNTNRILVWNSIPTTHGTKPDFILGQPSSTGSLPNIDGGTIPSRTSLWNPTTLNSDGVRLAVSDDLNNRVLIYNRLPSSSEAQPDVVIGQPNFSSGIPNNNGVSASTLSNPRCAQFINERFFVCDSGNFRVLVWNSVPTSNGQPADYVLGQPDMTSTFTILNGVSARSLNRPHSIASDGTSLAISDSFNHRVLIWDTMPTTSFAAADRVLGQLDMTSNNTNFWQSPRTLSYVNGKLSVSTLEANHRILWWNGFGVGDPAGVWGQNNLNAQSPSFGANRCPGGWGHFVDEQLTLVTCHTTYRILITPTLGP